jgi:Fe2+ transport system protein FeoA
MTSVVTRAEGRGEAVPLSALDPGQGGRLAEIRGGAHLVQRLAAMGMTPGVELRVVRRIGPAIIELRGSRVILGRGMLDKLWVRCDGTGQRGMGGRVP